MFPLLAFRLTHLILKALEIGFYREQVERLADIRLLVVALNVVYLSRVVIHVFAVGPPRSNMLTPVVFHCLCLKPILYGLILHQQG